MGSAPQRLRSVVLTNIEAYDAWPSDEERIYIKLIVHTLTSPVIFALLHSRHVRRRLFAIAAHRRQALTDEVLEAFVAPHIATAARWQRLRRFFAWQLDPAHRRHHGRRGREAGVHGPDAAAVGSARRQLR
jgi:hypothetical protein